MGIPWKGVWLDSWWDCLLSQNNQIGISSKCDSCSRPTDGQDHRFDLTKWRIQPLLQKTTQWARSTARIAGENFNFCPKQVFQSWLDLANGIVVSNAKKPIGKSLADWLNFSPCQIVVSNKSVVPWYLCLKITKDLSSSIGNSPDSLQLGYQFFLEIPSDFRCDRYRNRYHLWLELQTDPHRHQQDCEGSHDTEMVGVRGFEQLG